MIDIWLRDNWFQQPIQSQYLDTKWTKTNNILTLSSNNPILSCNSGNFSFLIRFVVSSNPIKNDRPFIMVWTNARPLSAVLGTRSHHCNSHANPALIVHNVHYKKKTLIAGDRWVVMYFWNTPLSEIFLISPLNFLQNDATFSFRV